MRKITVLRNLCILLSLLIIGCKSEKAETISEFDIPTVGHDLSYISFDAKADKPNYIVCDSTSFGSGRNRVRYIGGSVKLRQDITSNFKFKPEYKSFDGYVVVRFLVNCEGKSGRYRAQSLNLDFSPSEAPSDLLKYSIELIKSLDNWEKAPSVDPKREFSKYINLKISNGTIQHVLL